MTRSQSALTQRWRRSVVRRAAARGPLPDRLTAKFEPLFPGDPAHADAIYGGRFDFGGLAMRAPDGDPWALDVSEPAWLEALHGFRWLNDFSAAGTDNARDYARRLVMGWLRAYGDWHPVGWAPAVIGDRIGAWVAARALLLDNAELVYRSDLLRSLGQQARYLRSTADSETTPWRRVRAALGLLYAGLSLPGHDSLLAPGLKLLEAGLARHLTPAGGPVSRNPEDLLETMARLAQLQVDLDAAGFERPASLDETMARCAPILRMLRQSDGGLSVFHGGHERADGLVERVLARLEARDAAPELCERTGYHRLASGRTVVVMDSGAPALGDDAARSHASALAIEVGVGRRRLVVNCGSGLHVGAHWATACRGSAAHSTVCVSDASSSAFGKGAVGAPPLVSAARITEVERAEDEHGVWALAVHDGYAQRFGLLHRRRLFLAAGGADLRGEDTLICPPEGEKALTKAKLDRRKVAGLPFVVRFHLHPDVEAALTEDAQSATLRLPNGDEWSLRCSGGRLALEESVYLGAGGAPIPTLQAAIHAAMEHTEAQVKWAFRRTKDEGRAPRDLEPARRPEPAPERGAGPAPIPEPPFTA